MKNIECRLHRFVIPVFTMLLLTIGCSGSRTTPPAGTVKSFDLTEVSPIVASEKVSVDRVILSEQTPADYLVGPGDILSVSIYGVPNQLSEGRGDASLGASRGSRVDSSGSIQLPHLGSVKVTGLSLQQIRDLLQDLFRKYLKKPSVVVEIVEYKSHPLYLIGQFKNSGTYYMDRPLNLLQGIALAHGLDPSANLRGARLLRGNRIVPVDIYSLLHDGDQSQNVMLSAGDTIYVPDGTLQNVFIFGAVKNPGPLPMKNGQLYLHQALAAAGGLQETGHEKNIRIIRSISPTRGELIVVDLQKILEGESRQFPLSDGDIVYIPKNWVGDWNQAINEILPSLQLLGAVLNPFVQIKFLSD